MISAILPKNPRIEQIASVGDQRINVVVFRPETLVQPIPLDAIAKGSAI